MFIGFLFFPFIGKELMESDVKWQFFDSREVLLCSSWASCDIRSECRTVPSAAVGSCTTCVLPFRLYRRISTLLKVCLKSSIFTIKLWSGTSETFFDTLINRSLVTHSGCRTFPSTLSTEYHWLHYQIKCLKHTKTYERIRMQDMEIWWGWNLHLSLYIFFLDAWTVGMEYCIWHPPEDL